jgi:antitoxin (DNA-binding transcriptional repressor) of toxin-antitoxin stability system
MAKKSDRRPRDRRISATAASRSFSRLLDRIQRGESFVVHRHGRDVCVMAPPAIQGRRASECLELLRGRSPVLLDDGFGADLLEILAAEPVEERPRWDS